ncbi:MAG: M23 family metallopeptidase [Myxococcaceae bacterium]|nr:M23 family metallopeptidase [Myxococcaceae bacterium]
MGAQDRAQPLAATNGPAQSATASAKTGDPDPTTPGAATYESGAPNPTPAAAATVETSSHDPSTAHLHAAPLAKGLKLLQTSIEGPLESAIVAEAGSEIGPALTQVVTRTLVWWVRVPDDLLRGDRLSVLYEVRPDQEPLVHAVRFESGKTGRTHKAFLFKPASETYPRFYEPDGRELELRLADAPLDDYEQVTSRLRDGRHHQGVDFKCPEGTPVKATFDGVITRRNWNVRGNGNSIELRDAKRQRYALYLHLSEIADFVRPGVRIHKGQVLGRTGNTGHSFAPHLHYQLMGGHQKALDPFLATRTVRRHVPDEERARFEAEVRKLDALLEPPIAGN